MQKPYSNPVCSPTIDDLFSLKQKSCLVIGGAGLLGSEISYAFVELGAQLIVASRNIDKCQRFIREITERYPDANPIALQIDISSKESINECYEHIKDILPAGLDVLVNCGWSGNKNNFESISDEDWDYDIEVCLNGVFRTIKRFFPLLALCKGSILNIASMYGHVAPDYRLYDSEKFANPPSYGTAKAGIIQLTKYLASFLSVHNIRVNCISPGPFPYESTQNENPEFIQRLSSKNPLNRVGKPHELKGVAALLCSEAGSYMTGQNICVDGGWGIW